MISVVIKKLENHFMGCMLETGCPEKNLKKTLYCDCQYGSCIKKWLSQGQFFLPKKGKAELFDSFAQTPLLPEFVQFLERNSSSYLISNRQIQGNFSTVCGQYSAVFLYYRCIGKTMKQFIRLFSNKKLDINDDKIVHLYQKYFINKINGQKRIIHQGGGGICIQKCMPRLTIC